MTDEEDISEVAEDVNTMADKLSESPGRSRTEKYVFSPMKAVVTVVPFVFSFIIVTVSHFDVYDVVLIQNNPVAYAGVLLAGAALSYLLYKVLYSENDDGYTPGPGERLEV